MTRDISLTLNMTSKVRFLKKNKQSKVSLREQSVSFLDTQSLVSLRKSRNYQSLATILCSNYQAFKGYTIQKATSKQEHSLLQILQERFISLENVRTLAIDSNRELLSFLLESEFKDRFFTRVDSVVVFEKDKFLDFLKLRILSKSYTAYGNKIGLQLESSLESLPKVVLNFPFKDCVLKGAQSKDEKQKTKEIFFNEVLAKSEIDVLFSPKALQNFELIGHSVLSESCGSSEKSLRSFCKCGFVASQLHMSNKLPCDFSHNPQASSQSLECQDSKQDSSIANQANSTHPNVAHDIDCHENLDALSCHTERSEVSKSTESKLDFSPVSQSQNDKKADSNKQKGLKESLNSGANLLIKGNNLLALHSLKKKFANKVKLIYIDPPYNTGNDSFNYNDNFNHSTWLTFMKNRLEIAREFLSDDGVIFIQCDDNEQAYLKVLCDEIFNRAGGGGNNFVATICWEKNIHQQTMQSGLVITTILF